MASKKQRAKTARRPAAKKPRVSPKAVKRPAVKKSKVVPKASKPKAVKRPAVKKSKVVPKASKPKAVKRPAVKKSRAVPKAKPKTVKKLPIKSAHPSAVNADKKLAAVTDSTKAISSEIRIISKAFADSNRILASMKPMISTLSATMQHIDKHSRQIRMLEAESQKIASSLRQITQKADASKSAGEVLSGMEKRLATVERESDAVQIKNAVTECLKIAKDGRQALDGFSKSIADVQAADTGRIAEKLDSSKKILEQVGELLHTHVKDRDDPNDDHVAKIADSISEKISTVSREIAGLREQVRSISEAQKTDEMTEHMGAISSKAEVLMGMPASISNIQSRLESVEEKMSGKDDTHQNVLSEYQASMRMISESKYGGAQDLKSMAVQTSKAIQDVGNDSSESLHVAKWAVLRMLECADRWELRFSDTLAAMKDAIGSEMLKEAVQISQVRDVYGTRAVDDTKAMLGIS